MGYLKEFLTQINNRDFHKFLVLWEEYCTSDVIEGEEFIQLLKAIKTSDLAKPFGQIVETALPLWKLINDEKESYEALRLLIDLETTNSAPLAEAALNALKKVYGEDPKFEQRLRLIGLRGAESFQGAISKYDLLAHMHKGNIVFHTGGWGTGEMIEVSFVREHLVIEFENVSGRKDISFANAFKTLIPLPHHHFLARRFADADRLEQEGRDDPVKLIKLLLHDLGPKTAADIKDELCELVIPEKDWTKWWQNARAKVKKDPMVETPESLKEPFYLRKAELSAEDRLHSAIKGETDAAHIVQTTYNFVRDTTGALKNPETKKSLQDKLAQLLSEQDLSLSQSLQILLLLEQFFGYEPKEASISQLIQAPNIEQTIQDIDIVAFKKRALLAVKEQRKDWVQIFLSLLFQLPQVQLRDYILKELNKGEMRPLLEKKLKELLENPGISPETFIWYFQKLVDPDQEDNIHYQNKEGQGLFLESFLVLFNQIEGHSGYRELLKKMYNMLSGKRYALVRQLLQGRSIEFTKEFLLLASKCQSLSDHDMKILRSLAEVVHPTLASTKSRKGEAQESGEIIWTTEEGFLKIQDKIRHIGTVEMIENAREIEAARALGDLRENSEFKFAQERRARLQSELKTLSEQLNKARIITKEDIHFDEVGVGSVVDVVDEKGNQARYSILGPWDANPDQNILSFNSKFAQAMIGKKEGEKFDFKDETFRVVGLQSIL